MCIYLQQDAYEDASNFQQQRLQHSLSSVATEAQLRLLTITMSHMHISLRKCPPMNLGAIEE